MKLKCVMLAAGLLGAGANAKWDLDVRLDGDHYVWRCLPVFRETYGHFGKVSESEHMFCITFAWVVAKMTDRACIPSSVLVMELVDEGTMFISRHNDAYGNVPMVQALEEAFQAKWPCREEK